jgi:pimeloyl-ACP methyl ester carboxylesterase
MHPKTMMPMICVRRSQGFLASAMILLGWIGSAFADEAIVCPSEMSEVWELSTRHLLDRPRCIDTANPGFQVYRYADGIWRPDEVDRAIDMDGRLPIVYVHGNFMERNNTRQRALIINAYLQARAQRPYRLIFLSWPSQREPHPLQDVRENALAAECQSLYLAWLLEKIASCPEVSLLGFSYGARCVTGGLHLTSGGNIRGLQYAPTLATETIQSNYRLAFVAPAIDRNWLAPWGKHRDATLRTDGVLSLYNREDPVLRRFGFSDQATRPVAAGYKGFVGNPSIEQYDCSPCVGRTHDERTYYRQCPHFDRILDHLLWNESIGTCRAQ